MVAEDMRLPLSGGAVVAGALALGAFLWAPWISGRLPIPILDLHMDFFAPTLTNEGRTINGGLITLYLLPVAALLLFALAAAIFTLRIGRPAAYGFLAAGGLVGIAAGHFLYNYATTVESFKQLFGLFAKLPVVDVLTAVITLNWWGPGVALLTMLLCLGLGWWAWNAAPARARRPPPEDWNFAAPDDPGPASF